jgi:hypothetical protein
LSSDLYPSEVGSRTPKPKPVEAELLPPIPAMSEPRLDDTVKRTSSRRDRSGAEDDWLPAPKNSTERDGDNDDWKPVVARPRETRRD